MKQIEQTHEPTPAGDAAGSAPRSSCARARFPFAAVNREDREPRAVVACIAAGVDEAKIDAWLARLKGEHGLAVLVLVCDVERASRLTNRLQRRAASSVGQARRGEAPEVNTVYAVDDPAALIPSEHWLESTASGDAADAWLSYLSERYRERLIGVLLSGSRVEALRGLSAVKQQGGLVALEAPDGRSDAALHRILSVLPVDLVLPIADLLPAIARFVRARPKPWLRGPAGEQGLGAPEQRLQEVLEVVRHRTGHDLRGLRPAAVWRRLQWRMRRHGDGDITTYLRALRVDVEEARRLVDVLLNRTTRFFRDPQLFEYLEQQWLPRLLERSSGELRVWCVGCATGEEAYSLAILLGEACERLGRRIDAGVLATDVHAESLARARDGLFAAEIERHVSAERLRRYFTREAGGYRVRRELREWVVFTQHDVLTDAPHSDVDLVSCRNLLTGMKRQSQQRVVRVLFQGLRASGRLVIGSGERIEGGQGFVVEHEAARVYRREPRSGSERVAARPADSRGCCYAALHDELIERHAPPTLLIDAADRVVHASARAVRYLSHPVGEPSARLMSLLPWPLSVEVKAGLIAARSQRAVVRLRPTRVSIHDQPMRLGLELRPALTQGSEGLVLLSFLDASAEASSPAGAEPTLPSGGAEERAAWGVIHRRELEAERDVAAQRLHTVIERYETNQEVLRVRNEELRSVNEELRSVNEELEETQQELRGANAELEALNREYRSKLEELNQLSNDLANLLAATGIATLFLDRELRILRFTPKLTELFNLRGSDCGRPLSDLTHRLGYPELADEASNVLRRASSVEREVQAENGEWYLTRLLPYRTAEERIGGVVVTFVDITARKRVEDELRQAKEYSEHIIQALPQPLLVLTSQFLVLSANAAFYDYFGLTSERALGSSLYQLCEGNWDVAELRTLLEEVLLNDEPFTGFQLEREVSGQQRRVLLLNARRLGPFPLILLGVSDITTRHDVERALRRSESRYRALSESSPEATLVVVAGRYAYANQLAASLLGVEHPHDLIGLATTDVPEATIGALIAARVQRVLDTPRRTSAPEPSCQGCDAANVRICAGPVDWDGCAAVQVLVHHDGPGHAAARRQRCVNPAPGHGSRTPSTR